MPSIAAAAGLAAVAIGLAAAHWKPYAEVWLPAYRWSVSWLLPEFRVMRLEVADRAGLAHIVLHAQSERPLVVGGVLLPSGGRAVVAVSAASAAVHVLILLGCVLLAAARRRVPVARAACAGAAGLAVLELVDVPVSLAGGTWNALILATSAPFSSQPGGAALGLLADVLEHGGRYALAFLVALVALRIAAPPRAPAPFATARQRAEPA